MPAETSGTTPDNTISDEQLFTGALGKSAELIDQMSATEPISPRTRSRSVRVARALKAAHKAEMAAKITEVRAEAMQHADELREAVLTDSLTGASSREGLTNEHEKIVDRFKAAERARQQEGHPERHDDPKVMGSALYIDIDKFKLINDTEGHAAGDKMLIGTVENIREIFRPHDVVARLGGDELVVLVPDASEEVTLDRAEQLRLRQSETLGSTLSIGVAPIDENLDVTLKSADDMMYAAKHSGRDAVYYMNDAQAPTKYMPPTPTEQVA